MMRRLWGAVVVTNALFLFVNSSAAQTVPDGLSFNKQIKSRYFSIYVKDGVDMDRLAMRVAVPASIKASIRSSTAGFQADRLEDQFDLLYLAVYEILEVHLKQFQSSVKVCDNATCLSDVAERLFGQEIKSGGFYVVALDALYVDSDNVTLNILGHELAHAVLSKYFVVPPSERIQEVLAGYVEYQLRNYTRTLP